MGHKGLDPDVLETNGVYHSTRGLAHTGRTSARHGLSRKPFYDDSAQAVQIQEVSKFDTVPKGAAGGQYGIGKAQCADAHGEVYRG